MNFLVKNKKILVKNIQPKKLEIKNAGEDSKMPEKKNFLSCRSFNLKVFYFAITAVIVATLWVLSLIFVFNLAKVSPKLIATSTATVQITKNPVAGKPDAPVKWISLLSTKSLKAGQKYIQLPKNAKNIKVTVFESQNLAQDYVKSRLSDSQKPLTMDGRKKISGIHGWEAAWQLKNRALSAISIFLADASEAVENLTESIIAGSTPVIETETSVLVEIPDDNKQGAGSNDIGDGSNDIIAGSNDAISSESQTAAFGSDDGVILTEYETPAPIITEQEIDAGKLVTVSDNSLAPADSSEQTHLTDVLAHTTIPEIYKVGQESKIKIKWVNNGDQPVEFHAYDLDENGKLDYVEWTVPHLSEQYFEIIFISKAFELDENREIENDIYDLVKEIDNVWAEVPGGHYVRAVFEQTLDSSKDITLYARPVAGGEATVEVYEKDTENLVAEFPAIDHEDIYKVYLKNLQTPSDTFDLKIIGDLDIDWIVDPAGWLTGWGYRKKITISNSNVDSDLNNFPLLATFSSDANIGDGALATGYDVRFTDSDGTTLLAYERESWSGGAGADASASFWVRVPTVATASTTDIYLYYGNASASTDWTAATSEISNCTSITNAECAWKEGATQSFVGIWHLNETMTDEGTGGTNYDSTANSIDGAQAGNDDISGVIGNAQSFDGNDYINAGTNAAFNTNSLTACAWANLTSCANYREIFSKPMSTSYEDWGMITFATCAWYAQLGGYATARADLTTGAWAYLCVATTGTGTNTAKDYRAGALLGTRSDSGTYSATTPMGIGATKYSGSWSRFWIGSIDEVRVSNVARGDAWLEFEYCNMTSTDATNCGASNSNEIAFAAQETPPDTTPPVPSSFDPASGSTISDTTPTITFSLNENGDCFASTDGDETYDQMSDDTDCTGDGTTSISCTMDDLGADGSKTIYVACKDTTGNKDDADTNEELTYTLNTSGNSAPVASSVSIDSGAETVVLTGGTTKNVVCAGTVTDTDGYEDITSVTAKLYRSGVGAGAGDDNENHYTLTGDSDCVPSGGSSNTETYTCTFDIYFYADPTDDGSDYAAQNWGCEMTPSDGDGAGTADTDTIEMGTLQSISVSSTINFGSVSPGQNSTGDHITTVTNTGNVEIDFKVSGGSLSCTTRGTIPVGSQEYSLSSFNYGDGTDLSDSEANINASLVKPTSGSPSVTDNLYWQVAVPTGVEGGCTGSTTFVVISAL